MEKKDLAEKLSLNPDSLTRALHRLDVRELDNSGLQTVLRYYAEPAPKRLEETVANANDLLKTYFGEELPEKPELPEQPKPEKPKPERQEPLTRAIKREPKKNSISEFVTSSEFLVVLVIIGSAATAVAITAPVFISVGVPAVLAYILSFYVDIASFVLIWHGREQYGKVFATSTALQAALTVGVFDMLGHAIIQPLKGASVAICLGIAIHGFSKIITTKR